MLNIYGWKAWLILGVCLLGVFLAVPNLIGPALTPSWLNVPRISLGLDLQGGSHLLLEVNMDAVIAERLGAVEDSLRSQLIKRHIGYTGLGVQKDRITLVPRGAYNLSDIQDIVHGIDTDLTVNQNLANAEGVTGLSIGYTPDSILQSQHKIIEQSIEIIRRRVDETGTKEPTIESEGSDRILLQLPGIDNPEHVKKLIAVTAKLTFQMVDTDISPEDALHSQLPPGDMVLPLDPKMAHDGAPPLYVVKRRIMVDGDTLTDAQATFGDSGPEVNFKFDAVGAKRFGDATTDNVGKPFAIVLDNKVIEAPNIREPILGGSGVITGGFTAQSAQDLALLLRAGALPAPLTILEERTVGPDLGADSIKAGTIASAVAITLVAIFMILFYGLFGIFANIALFFNLCLLLAALSILGATLTLPGIAGIALTMGMAVDANVLVNERIKEEARLGRGIISAIDHGFKRAYATIIDANLTHLIAGGFLFFLGSGPVKGFAVTLCLGILSSLFTTTMVSRLLVVWWLRRMRPKALPI